MTKGDGRKRTMIAMDPDLYERARAEAKRLGLPFNHLIVMLLQGYFGEIEFGPRVRATVKEAWLVSETKRESTKED